MRKWKQFEVLRHYTRAHGVHQDRNVAGNMFPFVNHLQHTQPYLPIIYASVC